MADNLYGPIGPAKPGARARMQRVDALAARARAARMPKRAGQGRLVDANLTLRQPDQAVKRKVSQASSRLAMLLVRLPMLVLACLAAVTYCKTTSAAWPEARHRAA